MATGIPTPLCIPRGSRPQAHAPYELHYHSKESREKILTAVRDSLFESEVLAKFTGDPDHTGSLYWGDNLHLLSGLLSDRTVAGKVRLIYIDPPFSTNSRFEGRDQEHAYDDYLSGSDFIESLRTRLIIMHEILAEDGSIYLHLDGNMIFEAKIIMDEIFGKENFRNMITRKKCNRKNYTRNQFGNISDYILFYTKSDEYVWNRSFEPWSDDAVLREYPCVEEDGRRYKKVPIHAPGTRNGTTGGKWKGMLPPPGKHWQYTPEKLDEYDRNGEIYWSSNGNPRRKVYFEGSKGIPVQDIWTDVMDANNQNAHITGYPTEKNAMLLRRIIEASSNPGDLVLDCFAGSGTTLEQADQCGRNWIGCDLSSKAIETSVKRLLSGRVPMGDFVGKRRPPSQPVQQLDALRHKAAWKLNRVNSVGSKEDTQKILAVASKLKSGEKS